MNRQPYKAEKRRKEIARQKKQEEKRLKRQEKKKQKEGGAADEMMQPESMTEGQPAQPENPQGSPMPENVEEKRDPEGEQQTS